MCRPNRLNPPQATIANLDGDFSGLQRLCCLHVRMAPLNPEIDSGSGMQCEFEIAKGMAGSVAEKA